MDTQEPYFQEYSVVSAEHEVALTALAPEHEMQRRQDAIVNHPQFKEIVGNDAYEIHSADMNTYWVIADNYSFRVDVEIATLQDMIGPGVIVLHFGQVIAKDAPL